MRESHWKDQIYIHEMENSNRNIQKYKYHCIETEPMHNIYFQTTLMQFIEGKQE